MLWSVSTRGQEGKSNYLLSLDTNTIVYIRRRRGGMSLITQELVEPWNLPKTKVAAAALTIFVYARLLTDQRITVIKNINIGNVFEKFVALFKIVGRAVFYPVALISDWLVAGHLVDKLILDGQEDSALQISTASRKIWYDTNALRQACT